MKLSPRDDSNGMSQYKVMLGTTLDLSYLIYGGSASFFLSIVLFCFASPALSGCLVPAYKRLNKYERGEWNDRIISNVNAVVSIGFSGYSLLTEDGMRDDKVWYDSVWARLACAIITGYMIADLLLMTIFCKLSKGETSGYIFHHLAVVYAYSLISAYGALCYFGMLRLIAEVSTLFVNQRWFNDILAKPRSSLAVITNGLLMLVTFFLFRMVTMPIYWYQVWQVSGTEDVRELGHIKWIMYIPTFVLDVLNTYWFYKMFKGFLKAVQRLKGDETRNGKQKSV